MRASSVLAIIGLVAYWTSRRTPFYAVTPGTPGDRLGQACVGAFILAVEMLCLSSVLHDVQCVQLHSMSTPIDSQPLQTA
jgi:hypothetical protein